MTEATKPDTEPVETQSYAAGNSGQAASRPALLFGGRRRCLTRSGLRLLLVAEQPSLRLVEIDINNRRRIERENLRQREAADDGIAERLANIRAHPTPHHP